MAMNKVHFKYSVLLKLYYNNRSNDGEMVWRQIFSETFPNASTFKGCAKGFMLETIETIEETTKSHVYVGPCGLMDKVSDFGSEDWGFESLRGSLVLAVNLLANI